MSSSSRALGGALLLWLAFGGTARADEFDDHYGKAGVLYKEKRFEEAIPELKKAFVIRKLPRLLLSIANLHHKIGQPAEALDYYQRFLRVELNPEAPIKAEVEANMQKDRALLEAAGTAPEPTAPKAPEMAVPAAVPPAEPPPAPLQEQAAAAPARRPIYKRWWFWTAIGAVVVGGIAAGAAAGAQQQGGLSGVDADHRWTPQFK